MTDTNSTPVPTSPEERIEQKLDHMITLLDHMNRRDHWRTVGGFIRGAVTIIPTLLILASSVYLLMYGQDLMQWMIQQTTAQASQQVQKSFTDGLLQNFKDATNSANFQVQNTR